MTAAFSATQLLYNDQGIVFDPRDCCSDSTHDALEQCSFTVCAVCKKCTCGIHYAYKVGATTDCFAYNCQHAYDRRMLLRSILDMADTTKACDNLAGSPSPTVFPLITTQTSETRQTLSQNTVASFTDHKVYVCDNMLCRLNFASGPQHLTSKHLTGT